MSGNAPERFKNKSRFFKAMIITLKNNITQEHYQSLLDRIKAAGLAPDIRDGESKTIVGLKGDTSSFETSYFMVEGVEGVARVSKRYKLASREFHPSDTIVDVSGVKVGNGYFTVIAGPCSVETKEQLFRAAEAVKKSGANLLRGGAFKPRTSPYDFQGLGEKGLELLVKAREEFELPIVTEIISGKHIKLFAAYDIDMYQVGARNMQNYALLTELGKVNKPVLLKRGPAAQTEKWLLSAEYIIVNGNPNVVFCERGIETFENAYRNVTDLNVVPYIHEVSHLPVIVDPSHAAGHLSLIPSISLASVAAGANGLILEVHPDRKKALSDANQQLSLQEFDSLMKKVQKVRAALGE